MSPPSCTVVVAEYNSPRDALLVRQWAPPECVVHVYSKSGSCSRLPRPGPSFRCDELPNVGRDLGTHLLHVSRYYDQLPDRLHLVPGVVRRGGSTAGPERVRLARRLSCCGRQPAVPMTSDARRRPGRTVRHSFLGVCV